MKHIALGCVIVSMLIVGVGCGSKSAGHSGAPISLFREHAERSCRLTIGCTNKVISFKADLEYPSHYGLAANEYGRLRGFVNELFNDGTNFTTTVDEVAEEVFKGVCAASTNSDFNADADLNMDAVGRVVYTDSRYFSYELDLRGLCVDYLRCTYDRCLERIITIDDLVPSNRFAQLRGYMRDYLKLALYTPDGDPFKERPVDWPMIKDTFTVDDAGLTWIYSKDELDFGSWVEIRVGWNELKNIVDSSLLPTGRCEPMSTEAIVKDESDWWQFPYERSERNESTPPCPPFAGTNYPHASVTLKIESPCQGGMTTSKFAALQLCLAGAISPHSGSRCQTVAEAVHCELVHFWNRLIKEWDGRSPESGYGIYELETKILYRGPEYVSFRIDSQDGCPCCAGVTNVVWSWRSTSPLHINDVISTDMTNGLKRLMRQRVREDLAEAYADNPDVVLPDYAKGWPHSFDNFALDADGVTWFCDAGEVLIGGKGPYETVITWQELAPFLIKTFSLPTRAK